MVGSRLAYDCASFISFIYNHTVGFSMATSNNPWTTSSIDAYKNEPIDGSRPYFYCVGKYSEVKDQMQPGDIIMADKSSGSKYDHAMIYLGNGMMAHASPTDQLKVTNIWKNSNSYVLRAKPGSITTINTTITWPDDGETVTVPIEGGSGSSSGNNTPYSGATDAEVKYLEKLVAAEAGTEPLEGKIAVASVVLNRAKSSRFSQSTITDVINASGQFSTVKTKSGNSLSNIPGGRVNAEVVNAVSQALKGVDTTVTSQMPQGALYFERVQRVPSSITTWEGAIQFYKSKLGDKIRIWRKQVYYYDYSEWTKVYKAQPVNKNLK